jgi:hypothetical protein
VHEGREVHTQPHLDHLSVSSAIISLGSILLAYVLVSGMQLVPHYLCWLVTVFIDSEAHGIMGAFALIPTSSGVSNIIHSCTIDHLICVAQHTLHVNETASMAQNVLYLA